MIFSKKPTEKETRWGLAYLATSLLLIPPVLSLLPLSSGQLNFLYYVLNFCAVVWIFRSFLESALSVALDRPFYTLYYAALAYLGICALGQILEFVLQIFPDFSNVNDQGILSMLQEDPLLMAVGTVILVPVAEECFYRGLIFRNLYDRRPVLAYLISMVAFAAIHVVGYVGTCDPLRLLLCFTQYLPAGYCLCFAYRHSGTILSPILVHALVNAVSIYSAVR